jgi:hypothetical protein
MTDATRAFGLSTASPPMTVSDGAALSQVNRPVNSVPNLLGPVPISAEQVGRTAHHVTPRREVLRKFTALLAAVLAEHTSLSEAIDWATWLRTRNNR